MCRHGILLFVLNAISYPERTHMVERKSRICPQCGKEFYRKGNDKWTTFCSRVCGRLGSSGGWQARFQRYVDSSGGPNVCWPWTRTIDSGGYGVASRNSKTDKAHRVAWEIANRESVPSNLKVLHTCDNRHCCNPKHLFIGTQQDNMDDMVNKGRSADKRGTNNGRAKLTEDDIREIRSLFEQGHLSQQKIESLFNVSQMTVSYIIRRKLWPEVV